MMAARMRLPHAKLAGLLVACILAQETAAHASSLQSTNPRGIERLTWSAPNIVRTITAGYPDSFGLFSFLGREPAAVVTVHGKSCIKANFLAFDVDDAFAYDIDEAVTLKLTLLQGDSGSVFYGYDKNGGDRAGGRIAYSDSASAASAGLFQQVEVGLDRARFVNRGMKGTDLALAASGTMFTGEQNASTFTLCALELQRADHKAKQQESPPSVEVAFQFFDENGQSTAVRMGLYDATQRLIMPGEHALPIYFYDEIIKQQFLSATATPQQYWPVANRYYFYSDGRYRNRLKPGEYTLVVSKGPEYRYTMRKFTVQAKRKLNLRIDLERWIDMAQRQWASGDVHIHVPRTTHTNQVIAQHMAAEGLNVANILQMNNPAMDHYLQPAWGSAGTYRDGSTSLVPGIEAPRTAIRGHALALNINELREGKQDYLSYHRAFEFYRRQQAIVGYAHVGSEEFNASLGLAIDAPFGLIDFVEIMQNGRLRTELWYELLNLGFQIAPAAGSDFPYFDQPGAVRSYVKLPARSERQQWHKQLKSGATFVTSGPLIELTANAKNMGSVLKLRRGEPISIRAESRLNPDVGSVKTLSLIRCGQPIEAVNASTREQQDSLHLTANITVAGSMWLAVRSEGSDGSLAHSAPIYVDAGDGRSWCTDGVPRIVSTMRQRLTKLRTIQPELRRELEYWALLSQPDWYVDQLPALTERIELADQKYIELLGKLPSEINQTNQ